MSPSSYKRLEGFDYRLPYYYMVTLKRLPGLCAFSELDPAHPATVCPTPVTQALEVAIRDFLAASPGIERIQPYVIMPDHLHLLVKLNGEVSDRLALPIYVRILVRVLTHAYCTATGHCGPVFEPGFHDFIVKRQGQLHNFAHYILENPRQALLRATARDLFMPRAVINHWRLAGFPAVTAVGNVELLEEPALLAVKLSRSVQPGTSAWQEMERFYSRWRPGMVAIGTWFSPAEQYARRLILAREGSLIVLSPRAYERRWHPSGEEAQRHCAEGRLLTLFPFDAPIYSEDVGETRRRCLRLNALAKAAEAAAFPAP